MELIVISDTRMKIMLSREDMSGYDIDALSIDTESAKTKRILNGILAEANKSAGIECSGDRAFVQLFPSLDGGCEMYVTRFSELSDNEAAEGSCVNMNNAKNTVKRRSVYRFRCMRELLCACKALKCRGYSESSDSYMSVDGECFYLVLCEGEADTSVVLEYAEPVFFGGARIYISEHSSPLCENNAVDTLAQLC